MALNFPLIHWTSSFFLKLNMISSKRNSTLFLIFSLWAVRKLIWSESGKFSQVHKGDKIGLEKPISKASRSEFFLPREPEKTFHQHFISVWAHPKSKIFRTDCFISFFGVFVCNSSKIKIYFATIKLWMPPVSRSSPENSRPEAFYFPIIQIMDAPSFQEFPWK